MPEISLVREKSKSSEGNVRRKDPVRERGSARERETQREREGERVRASHATSTWKKAAARAETCTHD